LIFVCNYMLIYFREMFHIYNCSNVSAILLYVELSALLFMTFDFRL